MNLSPINLINNYTYSKSQKLEKSAKQTYGTTNSIASNTLQEAIGRSQVSFKGIGKITKEGFEYEQKSLLTSSGEDLKYNKTTGELEFKEYYTNGDIKRHIRFIPQEKTTFVLEHDEDGITTQTTTCPKGVLVESKDEEGRQIYWSKTTEKGKIEYETNHERKRTVIKKTTPEGKTTVQVKDLNTNKFVTKGPLVEDEIEVKDGVVELTNIVTGEVYKRTETFNKGKSIKTTEFSRETGIISKEIIVDKGETTTTEFSKEGIKEKRIITDKKGTTRIIIKYGADGIHEISKVKVEYGNDRKVKRQTVYQPNMDIIQYVLEIGDRDIDEKTYHYYNTVPNKPSYSETYIEGRLAKLTEYYDNGKSPKKITNYDEIGSFSEEYYEETGKKPLKQVHYFDKDKTLRKIEIYDTTTGRIEQTREQHPSIKGLYIVQNFDSYTGVLIQKDTVTHTDLLMERILYHDNGMVPKKIIRFNKDRSFKVEHYDEAFHLLSEKEYNKDRTPKN